MNDAREGRKQRGERNSPLESVAEIDQKILHLLLRRYNLLEEIRKKGHLQASEEKYLREAWQKAAAAVSRDPDLSGKFFSLMQQVSFLPKPEDAEAPAARSAFNLAPPQQPVQISLTAPVSWLQTCAWVYMAAAAGASMHLGNSLQNDTIVDCIRGLVQMGGAITREEDAIVVRGGSPLDAPDKVIFTGDNEFNFFLFTAHYLGRHSRVKLSGGTDLQLANYSALSGLMPLLGARMVHIMPKSTGLPVRLESSGILPPGFIAPPQCPAGFLKALLLAAPFYSAPLAIDLSSHPDKQTIIAQILPILQTSGVTYAQQGDTLSIDPGATAIPQSPRLDADPELAAFLLCFPAVLGGQAALEGSWPFWPETTAIWRLCQTANWQEHKNILSCAAAEKIKEFLPAEDPAPLPEWGLPLLAALAACAALHNGRAKILPRMRSDINTLDFLRAVGLTVNETGELSAAESTSFTAWMAPTAAWAIAYALAACARSSKRGFPLGNPGIITGLWPYFWQFYNKLPDPHFRPSRPKDTPPQPKQRRRILTESVVQPPAQSEE